MKAVLVWMLLLTGVPAWCQHKASFASIDAHMYNVEAPTPDSLARYINRRYTTELEKVRAIYAWIVSHIAYNTAGLKPWLATFKPLPDPLDTAAVWPSGDEMTARQVMRRRTAVCDGYARLFKVLCEQTGLQAVLVQGYARVPTETRFRTNHTWNAVRIDSLWQLVDVTWASGYLNYGDEYVQRQNDFYFFTPPAQFVADHHPEELRWTLLPEAPSPVEFKRTPFRTKNFYRYGVADYSPDRGLLHAAVGDTVEVSILLKDLAKARKTGPDPFVDTAAYAQWPSSVFIKPIDEAQQRLRYRVVVPSHSVWVNLLYNDDVVLRYRLQVQPTAVAQRGYPQTVEPLPTFR